MTAAKPSSPGMKTVGKSVAPLITMGATWGARKVMAKGYESATGKPAPVISSHEAGLLQKMLWAAALGAVVGMVQSAVWHFLERGDG